PKVDYILQYNAQNVKNKFDIPNNKKVILYAPTFSKTMESASELLPIIPETVRDDETWLLKFHELMDENIINEIKERNLPNIKIIDTIDITPLLHASDVLISDTSSVIYEFMVLKKPVITYKTQNRKDKGINIQSSNELRSALDEALKRPYAENCNKHLKEVNPYLDGQITKRVFETLTDIKVKNLLPNKRKPFNMFRKWQVIYHSLFQKGYLR
ncbi:MAG: CDP-glycerol glycerophosphotransferase family protein, partial [Calditrichia bacterium]|nr:CDP-glycerol glycerophosphotransferase family protein [Calditrichia bacterium]